VPGSSVAGSPEFNRVAQLQISPVFVARRISDVKTEYRSTRQGHDRSTHRFGLVLPFCVTAVFDPKPSKAAILHPANQCGNRVTEPDRTNWRPTSQTSPVWIFAKRSPELCRHCSFRARGVRRPTLDTWAHKPSSLFGHNLLLSLLTQHQANASEAVSSGSSERKVERVSELRSRRVSQHFRLDIRDSTRDECRRDLPLRNPFRCKR